MAHFTKLRAEDVASLAAEFSLGRLDDWKSIAAGTINSNYRLQTSQGVFFLRVNEGKTRQQVQLEISILTHLVKEGVPSPLPKLARSGQRYGLWKDKFISVFEWLEGSHVTPEDMSETHCHSAGAALARLHAAGASMDLEQLGDGRYSYPRLKELFATFASLDDSGLCDTTKLLAEEFTWLDSRESERGRASKSLIHADLFPDNVLVVKGEVAALLDFEQACVGARVYDLAVAVNAWCFAEALIPQRVAALLAGYQSVAPLEPADVALLPTELRASALRFTITRITDIYLTKERGNGKDFRRFVMRLQTWQSMESATFYQIADLAR